jgi:hypothetical protein
VDSSLQRGSSEKRQPGSTRDLEKKQSTGSSLPKNEPEKRPSLRDPEKRGPAERERVPPKPTPEKQQTSSSPPKNEPEKQKTESLRKPTLRKGQTAEHSPPKHEPAKIQEPSSSPPRSSKKRPAENPLPRENEKKRIVDLRAPKVVDWALEREKNIATELQLKPPRALATRRSPNRIPLPSPASRHATPSTPATNITTALPKSQVDKEEVPVPIARRKPTRRVAKKLEPEPDPNEIWVLTAGLRSSSSSLDEEGTGEASSDSDWFENRMEKIEELQEPEESEKGTRRPNVTKRKNTEDPTRSPKKQRTGAEVASDFGTFLIFFSLNPGSHCDSKSSVGNHRKKKTSPKRVSPKILKFFSRLEKFLPLSSSQNSRGIPNPKPSPNPNPNLRLLPSA